MPFFDEPRDKDNRHRVMRGGSSICPSDSWMSCFSAFMLPLQQMTKDWQLGKGPRALTGAEIVSNVRRSQAVLCVNIRARGRGGCVCVCVGGGTPQQHNERTGAGVRFKMTSKKRKLRQIRESNWQRGTMQQKITRSGEGHEINNDQSSCDAQE